jgi:hypothetical protein
VAVVFLGWLLLRADSRPRLALVAMTLVLAGALGNLIDNLWTGCARAGIRSSACATSSTSTSSRCSASTPLPAFNVADSCITVGACAWILASFLHRRRAPAPDARARRAWTRRRAARAMDSPQRGHYASARVVVCDLSVRIGSLALRNRCSRLRHLRHGLEMGTSRRRRSSAAGSARP